MQLYLQEAEKKVLGGDVELPPSDRLVTGQLQAAFGVWCEGDG